MFCHVPTGCRLTKVLFQPPAEWYCEAPMIPSWLGYAVDKHLARRCCLLILGSLAIALLLTRAHADTEKPNSTGIQARLDSGDLSVIPDIAKLQPPRLAILALRNIIHQARCSPQDPKNSGLTEEAARCLVTVPGHARYSADTIETARKAGEDADYDQVRAREFWFLGWLKSEETILVLCSYLSDDAYRIPPRGADYSFGPPNSILAASALGALRLPDAPVTSRDPVAYNIDHVKLWREWWAKRQKKE